MNELIEKFQAKFREHKAGGYQRTGQAYFNALHEVDPVLAKKICASKLDPFYRDDRVPAFLDHVYTDWSKRT